MLGCDEFASMHNASLSWQSSQREHKTLTYTPSDGRRRSSHPRVELAGADGGSQGRVGRGAAGGEPAASAAVACIRACGSRGRLHAVVAIERRACKPAGAVS